MILYSQIISSPYKPSESLKNGYTNLNDIEEKIMGIKGNMSKDTKIYIIDFLNIFSDYREIEYKLKSVNFHDVKNLNKDTDTRNFFKFFFNQYISYAKINVKCSNFIFVLKKLTNYGHILTEILNEYSSRINIKFIIINTRSDMGIIDKNKDDFLCQYIMCALTKKFDNCILISNDRYRDRVNYINEFRNSTMNVSILTVNQEDHLEFRINKNICNLMTTKVYSRCSISKHKFKNMLNVSSK